MSAHGLYYCESFEFGQLSFKNMNSGAIRPEVLKSLAQSFLESRFVTDRGDDVVPKSSGRDELKFNDTHPLDVTLPHSRQSNHLQDM